MAYVQQVPQPSGPGNTVNLIQALNRKVTGLSSDSPIVAPNIDNRSIQLVSHILPYVDTNLVRGPIRRVGNNRTNWKSSAVVTCYYQILPHDSHAENEFNYFILLQNFIDAYSSPENFETSSDGTRMVLSYEPLVEIFNPIDFEARIVRDYPKRSDFFYYALELSFDVSFHVVDCKAIGDC